MHASIFFLSLGVIAALPGAVRAQSAKDIDDLVRQTMKSWRIPGLAIIVVKDDRIVFLKGFGVRAAGKPESVTADTVFPVASCSKSFTTLAMGMLVDEGKMRWDDPVRKHVPYFRLSDPLADAAVTLRDVVCHRTGVGAHDLLWYGSGWKLDERIRHACKLDLEQPFRASFRYQVIFFDAAGAAVGAASERSWEDFVQQRILDPLEMKSSSCLFPAEAANVASPHRKGGDGKVAVIPRFPLSDPFPAGSIHSTAKDLANYLRFQLGDGTWKGKRLISAAALAEPHTPQVTLRREGGLKLLNPETLFVHYGMGWIVQDYRGKLLLMHGGSIDGFRAHLTLVPEERLGIAIVNNLDGGLANVALSNSIVDLFLKAPAKDWDAYFLELFEQGERADAARAKALREKRDGKLARPLSSYLGSYEDAAYGPCRVEMEKGQLVWLWAKARCPLEHFQGDTFLANGGPLVDAPFAFVADSDGKVGSFQALGRVFQRE